MITNIDKRRIIMYNTDIQNKITKQSNKIKTKHRKIRWNI